MERSEDAVKTRFEEWKEDIKKYCLENNLSFDKVCQTVKSWGSQILVLQFVDPNGEMPDGLNTETPLPVVLRIRKINGSLLFEQTEHTYPYLSN